MLKRNNRKGFTLAELLIVVAIIAVLVAIAVPLFVSALTRAQKATEDANIRAVRGAAVVEILNYEPTTKAALDATDAIYTLEGDGTKTPYSWALKGPWKATGKIDASGNVVEVEVVKASGDEVSSGSLAETAVDSCVKNDAGGYDVTVFITITNLKTGTAS